MYSSITRSTGSQRSFRREQNHERKERPVNERDYPGRRQRVLERDGPLVVPKLVQKTMGQMKAKVA